MLSSNLKESHQNGAFVVSMSRIGAVVCYMQDLE